MENFFKESQEERIEEFPIIFLNESLEELLMQFLLKFQNPQQST